MTTSVGSRALCTSPKGETTLFHSDILNKSNFIIPKKIMWNEVEFLETWHFANVVPTIEDLVFSNSFRHSSNPRISYYEPSRDSSSSIPDESPDMSPTYSQMINTVSLADEDFEINKDLLRKDFYSEVNKEMRVWLFSKVLKDIRTLYQEEFYTYLRQEKKNINKRVNNTSTKTKIWKTSYETVIESIHLPEAKIKKNINGTIVKASLFKTKSEDKGTASAVDVRRIMKQNNYTNMFLKTLGQLKRWWDNYLTFEDRNGILKAYMINEENEVVKDEEGQDIEDAVATLIYSISKHFIGDPAKIKDKTADLLTNLKCPKFHDFRWYREVFLTKVMLRSDCNHIVTAEGIKLCNDFKLKQRMRNEQRIYKNEFGSFCSQFGFNQKENKSPSKQRKKQVSRKPSKEKFYHNKRSDINQLDSSGEISSQTSSDHEECIKGNCDYQPKTINVISQDQELVLDVLKKVEDEKTKQDLYEVFKKYVSKQEVKKTINPYSLNEILTRFNQQYKKEIKDLRQFINLGFSNFQEQINRIIVGNLVDNQENLEEVPESSQVNDEEADGYLNTVKRNKFGIDIVALIDSGVALNCPQESLVPIKFCEKTKETLFGANGKRLAIKYKLSNAHICNQGIYIKQTFILVKDLKEKTLLGVPFLSSIYPTWEINFVRIGEQLKVEKTQEKFKDKIVGEVCSNLPNAFWHRKQHDVDLLYEPNFSEKNIPTKDLLDKKLIRKSKSPWSCSTFYVQKQAELEKGTSRLIAPLEFQNIMDENFNQLSVFIIVFIIEVLIIKTIKSSVKTLPSLALDDLKAFKIVKIDTSDIGYGGILRQSNDNHEILVRHTSELKYYPTHS
ncbi:hypothetical protein AAG906_017327 [Vitis piasezkii]